MKSTSILAILLILVLSQNISPAQNQLIVNVFASSALSEQHLSWFMDHQKISGSQITVQVSDLRNGQFIENCIIQAEAYTAFNQAFVAKIPASAFAEVQPGLYVLRGIEGLLKSVFNKAGVVSINLLVSKQGNLPVQTTYQFNNADYLTGFYVPSKNIWLDTPAFLTKNPNDPTVGCKTNRGDYYAVWMKYEYNNQVVDLIVPVNKSNHTIPADWDFYSQSAKALIVAENYHSFRAEQVMALKEDVRKIQEQIKIVYASGKSINLFVGLLNTLVKGAATGGASVYFDVKRTIAVELGKYFISAEINPKTHTDRYYLAVVLKNLNRVQDSLDDVLPMIRRMQEQEPQLSDVKLSRLYSKWKYALTTTALSIDLARNQFVNKSAGKKMLEAQIETVLSSAMPEQMKFAQIARFLQSNERSLIEAMKTTELLERSFNNAFERHWLPDGPARKAFEMLGGKSIKMNVTSPLPGIDQFTCMQSNGFNKLQWKFSATNSTNKFVIKYSSRQITESNWHQAYYAMMPPFIQPAGNLYEFLPSEHNERRTELYFAIRYCDGNGRTSHMTTCFCSKASVTDDGINNKQDRTSESGVSSSSTINKFFKPAEEERKTQQNTGVNQKSPINEQSKKDAGVFFSNREKSGSSDVNSNKTNTNSTSVHTNSMGNTITDPRDGKVYRTVRIGNQVWMAENLRFNTDDSWVYADNSAFESGYGRLYTWYDAMNPVDQGAKDICPPGWMIPSEREWHVLLAFLASKDFINQPHNGQGAGNALKSCRQVQSPTNERMCNTNTHPRWDFHSNHYGLDVFGFSALAGGYHSSEGGFMKLGQTGVWWTTTSKSSDSALARRINYDKGSMDEDTNGFNKALGFSVRCLKVDLESLRH